MNRIEEESQHQLNNPIISLLSPGLDSPVSTYLMMKQGFDCASLTFLNGGTDSHLNKQKMIQIGKKLQELTRRKLIMHFIDYDELPNISKLEFDIEEFGEQMTLGKMLGQNTPPDYQGRKKCDINDFV